MDCRSDSGSHAGLERVTDIRTWRVGGLAETCALRRVAPAGEAKLLGFQSRYDLVWHTVRFHHRVQSASSRQLRTPGVPVCLLLKNPRCLDDFSVIQRAANELQPYGQTVIREPARHADGRQPADISDPADGISKAESVVQVGFKLACRDRKRRGSQNVDLLEQLIHLFLQDAADTLGVDKVGRADLLV